MLYQKLTNNRTDKTLLHILLDELNVKSSAISYQW